MDQFQQQFEQINKALVRIGPINTLSKKTNIPPIVFIIAPLLILVIAVALDIFASGCTTFIGVAYPTFRSILALESKSNDDDKQWLSYWCIYGLIVVIDELACCLVARIPYYFFLKVCFLIWLFNPQTMGAKTIYDAAISPLTKKYQKQIEDIAQTISQVFSQ